jgi:hypothetical protein
MAQGEISLCRIAARASGAINCHRFGRGSLFFRDAINFFGFLDASVWHIRRLSVKGIVSFGRRDLIDH